MQTLMFANQKGGVGKSALATQFAYYLERMGKRVLFLDLDHQSNASKAISAFARTTILPFSATDVLKGRAGAIANSALGLIRADAELGGLERLPTEHNGFVGALRGFLGSASHAYDVCLIDTNPNPDIRYASGLISADYVLCPIQLNQEAIDGIGGLFNHARYGLDRVKAALNPNLKFLGVLPNLVEPTPFQRGNLEQLVRRYPQHLIELRTDPRSFALIQKRSVIAEAQAAGLFIADMRKTAARDTWREIKPAFEMIMRKICGEA